MSFGFRAQHDSSNRLNPPQSFYRLPDRRLRCKLRSLVLPIHRLIRHARQGQLRFQLVGIVVQPLLLQPPRRLPRELRRIQVRLRRQSSGAPQQTAQRLSRLHAVHACLLDLTLQPHIPCLLLAGHANIRLREDRHDVARQQLHILRRVTVQHNLAQVEWDQRCRQRLVVLPLDHRVSPVDIRRTQHHIVLRLEATAAPCQSRRHRVSATTRRAQPPVPRLFRTPRAQLQRTLVLQCRNRPAPVPGIGLPSSSYICVPPSCAGYC